tara:strand:+ start:600 stop:767 length:168 start_codon:yes stop_codon:yes gene_type:complete
MKITLIKNYKYVVRFYDKDDNKIGYMTCSKNELEELKNKKDFFGKAVHRTESNKV